MGLILVCIEFKENKAMLNEITRIGFMPGYWGRNCSGKGIHKDENGKLK